MDDKILARAQAIKSEIEDLKRKQVQANNVIFECKEKPDYIRTVDVGGHKMGIRAVMVIPMVQGYHKELSDEILELQEEFANL